VAASHTRAVRDTEFVDDDPAIEATRTADDETVDLVHAPTAIADDRTDREVTAEHGQGGLDHRG
jgi:hypothetical protein